MWALFRWLWWDGGTDDTFPCGRTDVQVSLSEHDVVAPDIPAHSAQVFFNTTSSVLAPTIPAHAVEALLPSHAVQYLGCNLLPEA